MNEFEVRLTYKTVSKWTEAQVEEMIQETLERILGSPGNTDVDIVSVVQVRDND